MERALIECWQLLKAMNREAGQDPDTDPATREAQRRLHRLEKKTSTALERYQSTIREMARETPISGRGVAMMAKMTKKR